MSAPDTDQPIASQTPPAQLRIVDDNVPAVLAHRLAHWSKDSSGFLVMTFAEERAQLTEPGTPTLAVCARVAIPLGAVPLMLTFLETAITGGFTGNAFTTSTVN